MNPVIITPYRNRPGHLRQFIRHYKDFSIYVIEQDNDLPFNRGMLLNIGFSIAKATHCIFHDIDMLCIGGLNHYRSYPGNPVQLATHAEQFGYRLPFAEYFGGVTMFSRDHFELCNGYSNHFWGWGGEDNLMYDTVISKGLQVIRKNCYHKSLKHERNGPICLPNDHPNFRLWKAGRKDGDGLDGLRYTINDVQKSTYTHIFATFLQPDRNRQNVEE